MRCEIGIRWTAGSICLSPATNARLIALKACARWRSPVTAGKPDGEWWSRDNTVTCPICGVCFFFGKPKTVACGRQLGVLTRPLRSKRLVRMFHCFRHPMRLPESQSLIHDWIIHQSGKQPQEWFTVTRYRYR